MIGRFTLTPLRSEHQRAGFQSGAPALDRYLRDQASQDIRRRVTNCFVAIDDAGTIAGYYTFAASGIPLLDLPAEETRRLPRYPLLPAGLIGRLAVDARFRGQGLGGALLADAITRATATDAAIFALVVDAKDEAAFEFYRHHGFQPLASRPNSLFLPIATALKLLS